MSWRLAAASLVLLGACAAPDWDPLPQTPPFAPDAAAGPLDASSVAPRYHRTFERSFTEAPFERGAMAVLAEEGGELATFNLVPCQGGQAVCGGSAGGPAGQLVRTPDWFVVTGLYGRTFWLSHGGDGYLERGGHYVPLSWNARENGTGDGTAPALETPFRH